MPTPGALPEPAQYARVDMEVGLDGEPSVMELELVEAEMFFAYSEDAVRLMVDTIVHELQQRA